MPRWSAAQAQRWYDDRPWPLGCNFLPSTAVNSTEQWQADTFDPATIDRELGFAAELGLNACRVFLQFLVNEHDPSGHLDRIRAHLDIAASHGIDTLLVLLDDCAFGGREPSIGPQGDPVPGVHNSAWTASPGPAIALDRARWPDLERYVVDVVRAFADDDRVLGFDLYNEPGNAGQLAASLPLLEAVGGWAQALPRSRPLTVGVWNPPLWWPLEDEERRQLDDLARASIAASDVVSFHSYESVDVVRDEVATLAGYGRPLLCTEWLMRADPRPDADEEAPLSTVETVLPFLAEQRIASFHWGLVNGRTQTHLSWGSSRGAPEPGRWFHDVLRPDGSPFDAAEGDLFRQLSPR